MSALQERFFDSSKGRVKSESFKLPEFPFALGDLKAQGYRSVGIDIIIGSTHPITGEPHFLFEECKLTEKTFAGQLAHPKETMKRDSKWRPEEFDETIRRCLRQELTVPLDGLVFLADPDTFLQETDTHVVKKGEHVQYKAFLFTLWDPEGFVWLPDEIDTDEVQGTKVLSLTEILQGDPQIFRECTQDIFRLLQESGAFAIDNRNLKPVEFKGSARSSRINGFVNIDLKDLPDEI